MRLKSHLHRSTVGTEVEVRVLLLPGIDPAALPVAGQLATYKSDGELFRLSADDVLLYTYDETYREVIQPQHLHWVRAEPVFKTHHYWEEGTGEVRRAYSADDTFYCEHPCWRILATTDAAMRDIAHVAAVAAIPDAFADEYFAAGGIPTARFTRID